MGLRVGLPRAEESSRLRAAPDAACRWRVDEPQVFALLAPASQRRRAQTFHRQSPQRASPHTPTHWRSAGASTFSRGSASGDLKSLSGNDMEMTIRAQPSRALALAARGRLDGDAARDLTTFSLMKADRPELLRPRASGSPNLEFTIAPTRLNRNHRELDPPRNRTYDTAVLVPRDRAFEKPPALLPVVRGQSPRRDPRLAGTLAHRLGDPSSDPDAASSVAPPRPERDLHPERKGLQAPLRRRIAPLVRPRSPRP
jgi:hypothetical protein